MNYFSAILDILYNFFGPHRPRLALWSLILLGLLTTANAVRGASGLGTSWSVFVGIVCLLSWGLLLPCIIFLIDNKHGHVKLRPRK